MSFEEVEGFTIIPNKVRFESNSEVFVIVSGQYPSCNLIKLFIFTFFIYPSSVISTLDVKSPFTLTKRRPIVGRT